MRSFCTYYTVHFDIYVHKISFYLLICTFFYSFFNGLNGSDQTLIFPGWMASWSMPALFFFWASSEKEKKKLIFNFKKSHCVLTKFLRVVQRIQVNGTEKQTDGCDKTAKKHDIFRCNRHFEIEIRPKVNNDCKNIKIAFDRSEFECLDIANIGCGHAQTMFGKHLFFASVQTADPFQLHARICIHEMDFTFSNSNLGKLTFSSANLSILVPTQLRFANNVRARRILVRCSRQTGEQAEDGEKGLAR